ncbi:MAG: hypothetical protein KBH94_03095 [Caldisericia bacterium]|nr:hypothetical protein [Caldisericia bacterium]
METYAFDIECFKNLFVASFKNINNREEKHTFIIGLGYDDREQVKDFFSKELTLVGYNSESYDCPMIRCLLDNNSDNINKVLFDLSTKLVDDNFRRDTSILKLRYPKTKSSWESIDLMKMMAFDKVGVSLKQIAINLKWGKIQDIPIEPFQSVSKKDLNLIIEYNLNDVDITVALYDAVKEKLEFRKSLSNIYGVDFSSASDSKIANLILEKYFVEETYADMEKIKKLRTPAKKVLLGECIAPYISFENATLKELYDKISSTYVYDYNKYKYTEEIYFAGCKFSLGIGGLHTNDEPGVFISDDKYLIQDMDVASYYPNIIINNKYYPAHLGEPFINILKRLTQERIEAKEKGDKVKSEALKITINSLFGKLGSDVFWLYDPKKMLSTTITGQLGLLMLVEKLYNAGISVISANTDGIVCKIDRSLLEEYKKVTDAWAKLTNLSLEFTPYSLYVRRDVNSYVAVKQNGGGIKEKGIFISDIDLKKSYRMPIVAKALKNYFINKIPVMETLESSTDIMDFCISQKTGANFVMELHTTEGIQELQKTNRFYISNSGGAIMKRDKTTGKLIGLYVGNNVRILNDYNPNDSFEDYDVNLSFYYNEVIKIIEEIEPKQTVLFDINEFSADKTVAKSKTSFSSYNVNENTASNLNKLGKNQFLKRISEIVASGERVEDISSRYIYVYEFNHSNMKITFYCLKKGIYDEILVDKKAYKDKRIEPGQVLYCSQFAQSPDGYILKDYKVCTKFEEKQNYEKSLLTF